MADNYPAAAIKHVRDSEALLAARRYDGAGYLAGYAEECTLKTLIWVETNQGRRSHNLNRLSSRAVGKRLTYKELIGKDQPELGKTTPF